MGAQVIDATGLRCPMPVLKARRALEGMQPGEVLEIKATDPVAPLDMQHFCNEAGHTLVSSVEEDGIYTFCIRCRDD
ncbi:MAG: sulfurtransferase TusA family protein [Alphaproteobacteria bacterium]